MIADPAHFDAMAGRAWPALRVRRVDGWLVRLSEGVTKRANSALPVGASADLGGTIGAVERIYRAEGRRPLVQVTDAPASAGVAQALVERGYRPLDETLVMTTPLDRFAAGLRPDSGPADVRLRVDEEPDGAWLETWWSVDGRGGASELAVARRILTGAYAVYASAWRDGRCVAVGRLTVDSGAGGLHCLATVPDERGAGIGTALLRRLGEEADASGASTLWLQVLSGNAGARRLYARLGFRPRGGYRYFGAPEV